MSAHDQPRQTGNAAQTEVGQGASRVLVLFFSVTGTTRRIAQTLAQAIGADCLEIEPEVPYGPADLDYTNARSRATIEQNDRSARPAIATPMPDWDAYDTVLIGHPIWWGIAPRILSTLLESNAEALAAKRIADFCTSGGSGIEQATGQLQGLVPGAEWAGGRRFRAGAPAEDLATWARGLGPGIG